MICRETWMSAWEVMIVAWKDGGSSMGVDVGEGAWEDVKVVLWETCMSVLWMGGCVCVLCPGGRGKLRTAWEGKRGISVIFAWEEMKVLRYVRKKMLKKKKASGPSNFFSSPF